jgi:hypothetical protein
MKVLCERSTNGIASIRLKGENGRRASFYLLGRGAIATKGERDDVAKLLRVHCGNANRPAYVAHLGSAQIGVRIGNTTIYGEKSDQNRRLDLFFDQVLFELGGYGSWWSESFALVRQTLDLTLAAYPVALVLLQDAAAWRPREWSEDIFTSWIASRKSVWGGEGDSLTLVARTSTLNPFVVMAPFVQTIRLNEWLNDAAGSIASAETADSVARVSARSSGRLELPQLFVQARIVTSADRMWVIDIVRPDAGWPADLHVADCQAENDDVSCELQWRQVSL